MMVIIVTIITTILVKINCFSETEERHANKSKAGLPWIAGACLPCSLKYLGQ